MREAYWRDVRKQPTSISQTSYRSRGVHAKHATRGKRFPGIQMFVDPGVCIDCGACEAECPVAAIYLDDDVPPEHRENIDRNAKFFGR